MKECIFCSIANSVNNKTTFWENSEFCAILDLFPNTKGQSLVIPKVHYSSNVFNLEQDMYLKLMSASKEAAEILQNKLPVKRVAMVCEGMGVDHAHVKLYPMHGLESEFQEMLGSHQVYFEKYTGQITTLMGPEANIEELEKLSLQLKLK